MPMSTITNNLHAVRARIDGAARRCGRRPEDVKLVAVSKAHPAAAIREAFKAGQCVFGENYVQELIAKKDELADLDIEWHFVGHLQRNKVKYIISFIRCIHSVDSIRLAEEIERRANDRIDCLIEVNLAEEASKTGIPPAGVKELAAAISKMEKIALKGLMTLPPLSADPERSRPYFRRLRTILDEINEKGIYPQRVTELSMGMTADLDAAIEEGATIIRVGTGIFGERI